MIEDNAASRPAMSSSQRFCLRWNNHQSNLLSVFDQLLHDESFVDVTLAVEGLFLKAHKMVLSACSPYFQTLFVHNPDKHPIVILKDVPYADMRSLLDFMYRGEVSVDQDRLTAFLRVAESLRIKGLTEVNEERCDLPTITSSLLSSAAAAAASASSSAATATPPPLQPQPTPPSQPSAVATPPIMPTAPAPSASPIALTSTPPPAPPPAHPPPPASSSSPMLERPTRPPPPAIPMPPKRSAPSPVHGAPPKRKRGRPRKLSGSDQTTTKRPQVTPKAEPSTTGSSESTPGASPAREKLGTSSPSADRSDVKSSEGRITRESKTRDGGGSKDTLLLSSALALDSRVKDDPEPTPGTSTQDVAQGYGSPAVTPDAEAYASVEAEGEEEEEEEEDEEEEGVKEEEGEEDDDDDGELEDEEVEEDVKNQLANDSHHDHGGHSILPDDGDEEWKSWKGCDVGGNWGQQTPWEDRVREANASTVVPSPRGTPNLPAPPPLLPLPPPPIHLYPIQRPARRKRRPASRGEVPLPPPLREGQPPRRTPPEETLSRPNHNQQDRRGEGVGGEVEVSPPQPQQVQARTSTGENIRTFRTALGQNLYQCLVCGVTYRHRSNCSRHFTTCHQMSNFHQCPFCSRSFLRKDNMMAHVRGVHK